MLVAILSYKQAGETKQVQQQVTSRLTAIAWAELQVQQQRGVTEVALVVGDARLYVKVR